ncbi:MAG: ABC transporter ATPase [Bacteroidota bacterium]
MQLFEGFSPDSKIWIYQCNRPFTAEEIISISDSCKRFTDSWKAHEHQLKASSTILYNRFIIFCVDENTAGASGCSIDKSVHLIREIEKQYQVFLLNRMQVAYMENDQVSACPLNMFLKMYENEEVNAQTLVFDNTITTLAELNSKWIQPVKSTWMNNKLPVLRK